MPQFAICPRCNKVLEADAADGAMLNCPAGHGSFVGPRESFADGDGDSATAAVSTSASAQTTALAVPDESLRCPGCLTGMTADVGGAEESLQWTCTACQSVWTEGQAAPNATPEAASTEGTVAPQTTVPAPTAGLAANLLYGLSLPERLLRGAVGLTAGTARELAGFLVPQAFQNSSSYRIAIENSLGFLTETIGGIPSQATAEEASAAEAGEHIARKAVGNFVDLAGLATLHVSPMWLLAVVSDVAYGTGSYARELAGELQQQGVIDDASTIHHVDDILAAVQRTCGTAAGTFDKPPFSVEELQKTIDEARESLSEADVRRLIPEAELRQYWQEMQSVAQEENVSVLGVSGAIAMQTLSRVKSAGQGTLIGIQVAGGLLQRNVLDHYSSALTRLREQGFFETVQATSGPYITAVWNNFSPEKKSWTESLLDPANATRLLGSAVELLSGGKAAESPTTRTD